MARSRLDFFDGEDPYRFVQRMFVSKWKPFLLTALYFDTDSTRYGAFSNVLPITDKVLTENLRELEADGLVERIVYPEVPPRVEYRLTDLGKSTIPLLFSLYDWGWNEMRRRNMQIDRRGQMFHGYLEPDEEIMRMPIEKFIELVRRERGEEAEK
jgi:DNA-binding HxlR family transcriptional regulator